MISRIIMVSASALCLAGLYFNRKQAYYQTLFETLKNCEKYHMDYVDNAKDLPLNTKVVLYGPVSSLSQEKIIASSFIKKSAQADRLWKMKLRNGFIYNTAANQPIQIQPQNGELLVFNLSLTSRQLKDNRYQQRAVVDGVRTCVYGSLKKEVATNKLIMSPEIIIGNQHETLLSYLDKKIMAVNFRFKCLTGLGTAVFLAHALYFQLYGTKSNIEVEIQKFKPN